MSVIDDLRQRVLDAFERELCEVPAGLEMIGGYDEKGAVWEGIAAHDFIVESECNRDVDWLQSEGIGFHFYLAPDWHTYTADADMRVNGVRHVVEIKRTERDLTQPDYRMKLAAVAEICRRCGWIFRIVLAPEIFVSRLHRENCLLFADRRFVHLDRRTIDALEDFAISKGPEAEWGEVSEALAPGGAPLGDAYLQALTIRRRVEVDLTARVQPRAPVRIH